MKSIKELEAERKHFITEIKTQTLKDVLKLIDGFNPEVLSNWKNELKARIEGKNAKKNS